MPISGPRLGAPADLRRLLRHSVATKPEALALVSCDSQWTWRGLEEVSDRLALNLLGLGLKPGDRIASLMPNRAALVIHYLGCVKAGLVAMPLNYRYTSPEIDYALSVAKPAALFAHAERAADIGASKETESLPLGVISYGGTVGPGPSFEQLTEKPVPRVALPERDANAPAFILFTSGTTSKPKGVTHSLRTFGSIVASLAEAAVLTADDILLPASSISHLGSLKLVFAGLSVGARTDVAHTFDGDELLSLLRETRPTMTLILPAVLFALVRDHNAKSEDFRSLRLVMSGGDKLPQKLEEEFTDLVGIPINELYGMTEIGTSHINPPYGINKLGSVGLNNPGFTSSIRDADGNEVPVGVEGCHWVKSPTVMLGYWNDEEATRRAFRDSWFDTGDIMRFDEDGYLWFCGRKKQIIVHDGSNINPEDIEDAIMLHPAVAHAGVVGVHDLMHGENVWAFITLKNGAQRPTSQDIIRFARERVGYKAPEVVIVLDSLPLNATGKIDRPLLTKMAAARVAGLASG